MAKNRALRLVIDTNLWISFLISHRQDRLDDLLFTEQVEIIFSTELLNEINVTMNKPKLKKYLGAHAFQEMLENIEHYIELVEVSSSVTACRDYNDNFLLALAKDGNADFLLTGDKDLLELKRFGKTHIVTITNFPDRINSR